MPKRPSIRAFLFILGLMLLSAQIFAEEPQSTAEAPVAKTRDYLAETPWKNWKVPPHTDLVITETPRGEIQRRLRFKSGVEFTDFGVSGDFSGKGAVLCSREIYLELLLYLRKCPGAATAEGVSEEQLREILSGAVERIDRFIVANSPTPITLDELQASETKRYAEMTCQSNAKDFLRGMKEYPFEKLKKDIDNLLSVPRPPVLNPCL